MAKYISLNTTADGYVYISVDQVLLTQVASSTAAKIELGGGSHHSAVVGTDLTSGFAMAIQTALKSAAETRWQDAVIKVQLPSPVVVTSIAVTILP